MKKILKRISAILLVFALMAAYLPLLGGQASADSYYSFSKPTAGATYKAGDKVTVKFWAGVQKETVKMDAWGNYDHTEYGDMHPVLKVFKGNTEIYSNEFTYKQRTNIQTTFIPKSSGTLKLCIYGENADLSGNVVLQATTTIKVKKIKASKLKSVKPEIEVDRIAKNKARISCIAEYGQGIKIYRATKKNGKYKLIKKTSKNTFTDKKLSANKIYYYKVKLYGKSGKKTYESKWSGKVQADKFMGDITLKNTSSGVKVSWKPVSGTGFYLIRRSTGGIPSDDVQALCYGSDETEFIDTEPVKGKTYYYTVEACRDDSSVIRKYSGKQYKITVK